MYIFNPFTGNLDYTRDTISWSMVQDKPTLATEQQGQLAETALQPGDVLTIQWSSTNW